MGPVGMKGANLGFSEWGDYDNDGLLDVFITGVNLSSEGDLSYSIIYKNMGNGYFEDSGIKNIPRLIYGDAAWGDYNNDGWLDIIVTGTGSGGIDENTTKLFKNQGNNSFIEVANDFIKVLASHVNFIDYDNDGDQDIFINGIDEKNKYAVKLYENINDSFVDSNINFGLVPGGRGNFTSNSSLWADFDNDGDQDLVLSQNTSSTSKIVVYKNVGNKNFTLISSNLPMLNYTTFSCADYNNDGLVDILINGTKSLSAGNNNEPASLVVMKNIGNLKFQEAWRADYYGTYWGSAEFGDYNNDGWSDILVNGTGNGQQITKVLKNTSQGSFEQDFSYDLIGTKFGAARWGDFDYDGDLDILITGSTTGSSSEAVTKLYRNNISKINQKPSIPVNLKVEQDGNITILRWDKATDTETHQLALTYNVRVGKESSADAVISSLSTKDGIKHTETMGNVGYTNFTIIKDLPVGTYTWSVQSVDNAFYESNFSSIAVINIRENSQVESGPSVRVPNVFTPNNDNVNDSFEIEYSGNQFYKLDIFNRQGKHIFTSYDKKDFWSGNGYSTGVYYYQLYIGDKIFKGYLHLLR